MYIPTKYHRNWPKNKGVKSSQNLVILEKSGNICSFSDLKNSNNIPIQDEYTPTKFHANRTKTKGAIGIFF